MSHLMKSVGCIHFVSFMEKIKKNIDVPIHPRNVKTAGTIQLSLFGSDL